MTFENNMQNNQLSRVLFTLGLGLVVLLISSTTHSSLAATVYRQSEETSLKELQQKWTEIDAKLVAKEAELTSGTGDVETIKQEFKSLVDEANGLIKKLEDAALKLLKTEPENQEAVRILMGIMLNDAQHNEDGKVLALGDLLIANGVNSEYFTIASRADRLTIPAREVFDELLIRQTEAMKSDLPRVKLTTTQGDVVLELFENEAPNTVGNFISLVENGHYNDTLFHRVIEGFMAQGGGFKMKDDKEDDGGGLGYEIKCECDSPEKRLHFTGSLSMAHRGKDTGGSQFFLTFERTSFLDGRHTCFGRVVDGLEVLEVLARTHIGADRSASGRDEPIAGVTKDKIITAEVLRKRDHEYRPDKVGGEPEAKQEETQKTPELSAPKDSTETDPVEKSESEKESTEPDPTTEKAEPKKDDSGSEEKSEPPKSESDKQPDTAKKPDSETQADDKTDDKQDN